MSFVTLLSPHSSASKCQVFLRTYVREYQEGLRTAPVRQTESGATYEDTVDHLSESEREVTGLVFALSGYVAHGVYEEVRFLLLDSLEAIDASRIGRLIEYIDEVSDYLVVALLPEDAQALPNQYERITEI